MYTKKERTAYERKYFPTFTSGLPKWFVSRKLRHEEKEIEAVNKQKNKKKEHKENLKDNDVINDCKIPNNNGFKFPKNNR